MNQVMFLILLITTATAASATTVVGQRALGVIEAFRALSVVSQKDTPGQLDYKHDVLCTREANVSVRVTDPGFAIPKYKCDLGSAKAIGARAKILFDGAAITFGTTGSGDLTTTQGRGLECRIMLVEADFDKRFICDFN